MPEANRFLIFWEKSGTESLKRGEKMIMVVNSEPQ